jgi:Na+-translocating ferredoxin:NAD+ oxidoreductase RnfE subunit
VSLFWETFAAALRIISYLLMTITFLWAGIYLTHGYYTGLPNIHWSFSFIGPLLIVNCIRLGGGDAAGLQDVETLTHYVNNMIALGVDNTIPVCYFSNTRNKEIE